MTDPTRLLAAIVESSNDAIVSKSIDGLIQTWNAAAERMFGYSAGEVLGRHISLIVPPDRFAAERTMMEELAEGQRVEPFETLRVRSDGRILTVSLSVSPVLDEHGHVVAISTIARDITTHKEAEARERLLLADAAETNAKFRAFFEQGALFAGITDRRGTLIEANRLSVDGCGYTREQVIGRKFWEGPWWAQAPDLVARIQRGCAQAAGGTTFRAEMPYFLAGGVQRIADVSILPITDDAGNVVLLAPTGADITDRKRVEHALRDSEERFRTLADNMSQLAWMADGTGQVFWYNERWFDYTGTTLEQMRGWGWTSVHHPDHLERVVARLQHSWDTGDKWEDTFPLRGRDGEYRWFLSRATPIRDEHGAIVRWFGTNTDITGQRELEEHLWTLSVELAGVNSRKDAFIATLSHELRNPLAAVRNSLALMKVASDQPELLAHARAAMDRQITHMVRLLDDLLDISRITHDRLQLQLASVSLATIIDDVVDTHRPMCERAGVTLSITRASGHVGLHADAERLVQIFGNLVTNACKYTPPGGQVWLSVEPDGDEVAIRVRDTGIGIPQGMLSKVFDLFAQVERDSEASQGGLGIGLSLVKRLVEMHGGTVTAHSDGPGKGSEFVVRLPAVVGAQSEERRQAPSREAPSSATHRILVVDDDHDSAASLAMLLQAAGHEPATAHDGLEAIERAAAFAPDVILLDLGLPRMDGREACRRIRAESWGKHMVIVALTGWGQETDRQQTKAAGFDHHLVKPVDPTELIRMLARMPGQRQADDPTAPR